MLCTHLFRHRVAVRFGLVFTFPLVDSVALLSPHTAALVGGSAALIHHPAARPHGDGAAVAAVQAGAAVGAAVYWAATVYRGAGSGGYRTRTVDLG